MRRKLRKHRLVFSLGFVILFIVILFPLLVFGRVLSPNDVFYNYDPWHAASDDPPHVQNPLIHDPPLSYYTLMSMLRSDPASFHWNRYIGSGIPGFGSVASAVLSPFIALPALLLPLVFVYSGIITLKILFPLWTGYLWLREERLGKNAAAVGAVIGSVAGPYAVWWLWQGTNATALYPALLYAIARIGHGKKNSIVLLTLLAASFLVCGYPAVIAYGGYLAAIYLVFVLIRARSPRWRELLRGAASAILALALTAPLLSPFISFLRRTGYLEARAAVGGQSFFPIEHWSMLIDPFRLGTPMARYWIGDSRLGPMNNFVEATVYLGMATLALMVVGVFNRRVKTTWFFAVILGVLVLLMTGELPGTSVVSNLSGLKYSPLPRLRVLLPIPVAFMAAAGVAGLQRSVRLRPSWRTILIFAIALVTTLDLALFAAKFYPHIRFSEARLPDSPTMEFLRVTKDDFRIAPLFPYLMPNASELYRVEDIRSHWGFEREYREILQRIDPGCLEYPTLTLFNSLRMNLDDPLLSMLGVRYFVEPPVIDILRWKVMEKSEMVSPASGSFGLRAGEVRERLVTMDSEAWKAVAIPFQFQTSRGSNPHLVISLIRPETGKTIVRRRFDLQSLRKAERLYVAIARQATAFDALFVRIESQGIFGQLGGADAADGPTFAVQRVRSSFIPAREFKDGRIFENVDALPRFWAVWESLALTHQQMLERRDIDFGRVAVVDPSAPALGFSSVPPGQRRVRLNVGRDGASQRILTDSPAPFLLASSEKLAPELEVFLEGKRVEPVRINTLFAAVRMPAGRHEVRFERRIGRGMWPIAAIGLLVLIGAAILERRPH